MFRKALLIIISLFFINGSEIYHSAKEIDKLTLLLHEQDLNIEEWTVTIQENIKKDKAEKLLTSIINKEEVTKIKEDKVIKYTWNNNDEISTQYDLIFPVKKNSSAHLTVVLKDTVWNQKIREAYIKKTALIKKQLFTKNAKRYTCIIAMKDDIIDHVEFFNSTKKFLSLRNDSTQMDNIINKVHNNTLYGYTPLLETEITITEEEKINLQLVIQQVNDRETKVIIGTPILINEY